MIVEAKHSKESGHWYRSDGTPAYTYINKKGEEKPTTLREARRENLRPSVTQIIKLAAAPGLQNWIIDQHILACLTMPRVDGESDTDYLVRIKRDAGEQARQARERGTEIHAAIQSGFEGKYVSPEMMPFYLSAWATLDKECQRQAWICEKSFATPRYGGKCDLLCDGYLIDIKTSDRPVAGLKLWDDHKMQLAAYAMGLHKIGSLLPKCGILYVNSVDASSRLIWVEGEDLGKGWNCFDALCDFYYSRTGLEVT